MNSQENDENLITEVWKSRKFQNLPISLELISVDYSTQRKANLNMFSDSTDDYQDFKDDE